MKKIFILSSLFFVLLASKCEDDQSPAVGAEMELQFNADFSGEPLLMYASEYDYEENMALRFQLFQFYISEVELLTTDDINGEGVTALDVDLISFKDVQSSDAASDGIKINVTDLPTGNYKGIRFKLGVAPDLNSTNPGDYSVVHPLSNHYWSASMGYVFTKIEGNADINGSGDFSEKLTFHVGTNPMLREVSFLKDINLSEGALETVSFNVDVQKILVNAAGEFLDFRETSSDHTSNEEVASFLADNLPTAISIN